MAGGGNGVARMVLQYTQDSGARWRTEVTNAGASVDTTYTIGSPLTGASAIGFITNETAKAKVYRWRAVTFDRANSSNITGYISKHEINMGQFRLAEGLFLIWDNEAPLSGVDGDGANYAGKTSLYFDINAGYLYRNDGTLSLPSWIRLADAS